MYVSRIKEVRDVTVLYGVVVGAVSCITQIYSIGVECIVSVDVITLAVEGYIICSVKVDACQARYIYASR